MGLLLSNAVTVLVSVVNIVIRTINMSLIAKIGYHTESEQTSAIMTSILASTFINTGLLLLFTNADLSFSSILSWLPLRQQYSDISKDWYRDIGVALVKTMAIMAVFPYVEFALAFGIKAALRMWDSGFYFLPTADQDRRTKKKT